MPRDKRTAATRAVVLDNEAVQALIDPFHLKHRRALAAVELVSRRNQDAAGSVALVVPTSVRVEAGWDRTASRSAMVNRVVPDDRPLDAAAANRAAAIRVALGVSVADAHIGAILAEVPGPAAVLTSDRPDVERVADHVEVRTTVVVL